MEASCGRAPLDARHVLCASTVADAARHASKAHGARSAGSPSAPAHTRRDAMFGTTRRRLRLASDMRPARLGSATPLGLLGSASSWPPCRLEQALVRMLSSPFCLRSPWWALHAPQAARRSAQQLACRGRRGRASCRGELGRAKEERGVLRRLMMSVRLPVSLAALPARAAGAARK